MTEQENIELAAETGEEENTPEIILASLTQFIKGRRSQPIHPEDELHHRDYRRRHDVPPAHHQTKGDVARGGLDAARGQVFIQRGASPQAVWIEGVEVRARDDVQRRAHGAQAQHLARMHILLAQQLVHTARQLLRGQQHNEVALLYL